MDTICLENEAFYSLLDKVICNTKKKLGVKEDRWNSTEQVMNNLHIKNKSTLKKTSRPGAVSRSDSLKRSG